MDFVNIYGHRVTVDSSKSVAMPKPKRVAKDESYHKGFRVIGIKPGDFAEAVERRLKDIKDAQLWKKPIPPELTYEAFCNGYRGKPVRAKPYDLLEAAQLCKAMAEKEGWDRVEIVALVHEAKKPENALA